MSAHDLPDFTGKLIQLQAKTTDQDHKIRMAIEYLEHGIKSADALGNMDGLYADADMALRILKREW